MIVTGKAENSNIIFFLILNMNTMAKHILRKMILYENISVHYYSHGLLHVRIFLQSDFFFPI